MNENSLKGIAILKEEFNRFGIEPTEEMLKEALCRTVPVNVVDRHNAQEMAEWLATMIIDSNRKLAARCFTIGLCTGLILTLYVACQTNKKKK